MSVCNCHGMIFLDCPNYYRNKEKAKPQMSTASENELVGQPICPICGSMMSDEMGWRQTDGGRIVVKVHCKNPEHVQDGSAFHSFLLDFPPVDVNAQVAAAVEECKQRIVGIAKELRVRDRDVAESPYRQDNVEWDCNGNALVAEIQKLYLSTESATQALERIKAEGGKTAIEEADRHLEASDDEGCSCRGHRILRQRQAQARLEEARHIQNAYLGGTAQLVSLESFISHILELESQVKVLDSV